MRVLPVLSLALLCAPPAFAAQVTEVADALDGDDPFDANLELKFDVERHSGLLTRENFQPPEKDPSGAPRLVDVKEMSFERVRFRIRPRLEIGIFHDLSLFGEWPIVIWDQQNWRFAEGTNQSNSTFARDQAPAQSPGVDSWTDKNGVPIQQGTTNTRAENQVGADGKPAYGFPNKPYNQFRFDLQHNGQFTGYRQGFDNPTFGVRFSPLNNERDDTKPTITLQADYTPPLFAFMDPTGEDISDAGSPGAVADGAHRFHFSIALSKRFLILDPYFVVEYGLPLAASGDGSLVGYFPRQVGGFTAGTEIVPYEDKKLDQKFAIDINAYATYFSEGRDYSEVSDVLMEQTYSDQWVRTGLHAGIFFKAFQYFFFDVTGDIGYDTPHLLTIEDFGTDGPDANKEIDLDNPKERNPFYNPALDTVGRRVRVEQSLHLGVLVHAGITF